MQASLSKFVERFETDEKLPGVSVSRMEIEVPSKRAKKGKTRSHVCLDFVLPEADFYRRGLTAALTPDTEYRRNGLFPEEDENLKHVVVEFSSPNVAKPFHVGHLRKDLQTCLR